MRWIAKGADERREYYPNAIVINRWRYDSSPFCRKVEFCLASGDFAANVDG